MGSDHSYVSSNGRIGHFSFNEDAAAVFDGEPNPAAEEMLRALTNSAVRRKLPPDHGSAASILPRTFSAEVSAGGAAQATDSSVPAAIAFGGEDGASGATRLHRCTPDFECPYCQGAPLRRWERFDWSFIDCAYCISLESRPDRAASAEREFHRVGLCQLLVFYRPSKPEKDVVGGIWGSHRAVALAALEKGQRNILVLEDDVLFVRRFRPNTLRSVAQTFGCLPDDWCIYFLGHWVLWAYVRGWHLLRSGSAGAHAYVANQRLLEWLRDHPYQRPSMVDLASFAGRGIDAAFAKLPGTYAYFPMVAVQSASPSNNLPYRPKKRIKHWRHLIMRSRYGRVLLSGLMRPSQCLVLLSPLFALHALIKTARPSRKSRT